MTPLKSSLDGLENALNEYDEKYLIISPPRCASTAIARVFWNIEAVQYYSHEPFEKLYFNGEDLSTVTDDIRHPFDLSKFVEKPHNTEKKGLVIKEMPYQVGGFFPELFSLIHTPLIFLIRDPRLSVKSRMDKKVEAGTNPYYAKIETGWELLEVMINHCRRINKRYIILDTMKFRNNPNYYGEKLFSNLGLSFKKEYLTWKATSDFSLDNLDGAHDHLYAKVLKSSGVLPEEKDIPSIDSFTNKNGLRDHITKCMNIYEKIRHDKYLI